MNLCHFFFMQLFDLNFTYNYTDWGDLCDLDPDPVEVRVQIYLHSIICAFGLVGNVLVLITYMFYQRTKTMTDLYLLNVAVADLIFVLALPFVIYNEQNQWSMGGVWCKVLGATYSINLYSGMLLLACISADRYVAIVQARRSFGARSHALTYGRRICSVVWVLALALTLPTLMYTERFEESNPGADNAAVRCQLRFDREETARLIKVLVPSLQVAIGYLLPLVVMVFCYFSIIYTLLRKPIRRRHRAVHVVLVIFLVFVACHTPYNVAMLTHTLPLFTERSCREEQVKLQVLAVSKSVAFLHCCLNPVLYAFVGVRFRSHLRQILQGFWHFRKQYRYPVAQSRRTSDLRFSGFRSSEGNGNMLPPCGEGMDHDFTTSPNCDQIRTGSNPITN